MNKRSGTSKETADKLVRGIKRKTRLQDTYQSETQGLYDQLEGLYTYG